MLSFGRAEGINDPSIRSAPELCLPFRSPDKIFNYAAKTGKGRLTVLASLPFLEHMSAIPC
jgi:hypothetical protein